MEECQPLVLGDDEENRAKRHPPQVPSSLTAAFQKGLWVGRVGKKQEFMTVPAVMN
jgi:hypothetical protein